MISAIKLEVKWYLFFSYAYNNSFSKSSNKIFDGNSSYKRCICVHVYRCSMKVHKSHVKTSGLGNHDHTISYTVEVHHNVVFVVNSLNVNLQVNATG